MTNTLRAGRALHLIDVDELLDGPITDTNRIRTLWHAYSALVQPGDAVVFAASSTTFTAAAFTLPTSIRWIVTPDNERSSQAIALCLDFDADHAANRYEWLVIGGTSSSFAIPAVEAKLRGLRLWTVTGPAASRVTEISDVRSRLRLGGRAIGHALALAA